MTLQASDQQEHPTEYDVICEMFPDVAYDERLADENAILDALTDRYYEELVEQFIRCGGDVYPDPTEKADQAIEWAGHIIAQERRA